MKTFTPESVQMKFECQHSLTIICVLHEDAGVTVQTQPKAFPQPQDPNATVHVKRITASHKQFRQMHDCITHTVQVNATHKLRYITQIMSQHLKTFKFNIKHIMYSCISVLQSSLLSKRVIPIKGVNLKSTLACWADSDTY